MRRIGILMPGAAWQGFRNFSPGSGRSLRGPCRNAPTQAEETEIVRGCGQEHADAPHALALLRARGEGPRGGAADKKRDERTPLHSITSSARASTDGGIVEPERLGGLEVEHRLILGRRLNRQIGRLLALEDAVDIAGRAPVLVDESGP